MLPKLHSCIDAIENGVSRVHILDGRIAHCLLLEQSIYLIFQCLIVFLISISKRANADSRRKIEIFVSICVIQIYAAAIV